MSGRTFTSKFYMKFYFGCAMILEHTDHLWKTYQNLNLFAKKGLELYRNCYKAAEKG